MSRARVYAPKNEVADAHGARIRKTRIYLGMTQTELGKLFGLGQPIISKIECGYYSIIHAYPQYQLLNERMRIWAEMNKNGKKKKYVNSRRKVVQQGKLGTETRPINFYRRGKGK